MKHPASAKNEGRDPVLPMFANGKSYVEKDDLCLLLVADLCTAKDEEKDARAVAAELVTCSHALGESICVLSAYLDALEGAILFVAEG